MDSVIESFRHRVRDFAAHKIAPLAAEIDRNDEIPTQVWHDLGKQNLLGVTLPKKYGGLEMPYLAHVVATEELSRASGSVGFAYAAHSNICLDNLFKNGTEDQRQRFVAKLISGEYLYFL